jgi:predicted small integral membrane protein
MSTRVSKALLVVAVALFATLVVWNNLTDYGSNLAYVRHVLSMDTTFAGNNGMWRRIEWEPLQHAVYAVIIATEIGIAGLCWIGGVRMWRARLDSAQFARARNIAITGLTAGVLLYFVGFIVVGGEWFLMWQSKQWDARPAATMFAVMISLVLIYVSQPEAT